MRYLAGSTVIPTASHSLQRWAAQRPQCYMIVAIAHHTVTTVDRVAKLLSGLRVIRWFARAAAERGAPFLTAIPSSTPAAGGPAVPTLAADVRIERDGHGVPHIMAGAVSPHIFAAVRVAPCQGSEEVVAETDADLFVGFGWAMAEDRSSHQNLLEPNCCIRHLHAAHCGCKLSCKLRLTEPSRPCGQTVPTRLPASQGASLAHTAISSYNPSYHPCRCWCMSVPAGRHGVTVRRIFSCRRPGALASWSDALWLPAPCQSRRAGAPPPPPVHHHQAVDPLPSNAGRGGGAVGVRRLGQPRADHRTRARQARSHRRI